MAVVDRATGAIDYKGSLELIEVGASASQADFEAIVDDGVEFDAEDEYVDEDELGRLLIQGGIRVDIGNPNAGW